MVEVTEAVNNPTAAVEEATIRALKAVEVAAGSHFTCLPTRPESVCNTRGRNPRAQSFKQDGLAFAKWWLRQQLMVRICSGLS